MVAHWITNGAIVGDGFITLNDGRTFTLADIPGNGWGPGRISKLNAAIQAVMDHIEPIADLPSDDPDRFEHEADPANAAALLLAQYGGRRFYNGTNIVSRSTLIKFTFENGELTPHLSRVS